MSPEETANLLSLYNSEYTAITARCTNYETIRYLILGSFLTFVTIAAAIYTYMESQKKRNYRPLHVMAGAHRRTKKTDNSPKKKIKNKKLV